MMSVLFFAVTIATALALMSLGGGLYEFSVVDQVWPARPELIQPNRGGLSRRRFWIPAHVAFELGLIVSLIVAWSVVELRTWLLVALVSHATMRVWSALDFIPKALVFEKVDPVTISEDTARCWVRRSLLRLPLDLVTCVAMLTALTQAGRLM
ncbi:hypothetical protein [Nodosilinea nodulosa]|uniref:hypothetical protein n=1 Tax=Nodosilinea nodulosa TaxID=416001 RepID=UPI0002F0BBB7|nr:hypothetical protein [Nodosilinea nodulosa]